MLQCVHACCDDLDVAQLLLGSIPSKNAGAIDSNVTVMLLLDITL